MIILTPLLLAIAASREPLACPPFVRTGGPAVIAAVAPRFPDIAVQARVNTTLEVCVEIGADGVPVRAKLDPPFHIMTLAAEAAALLWRFAPIEGQGVPQKVRLRFVLKLLPPDSAPAEETSIFRPPYEIEVRHLAPELVILHGE